ncbi:hypothetical protein LTR70_005881 [Exophiala xenobiotica]|uniref:RING-type domain-containing protein n=1 Tax=Lithohypha guttulata TaxID=1690604 RepID=A0ABR0JUN5_9EURO|nr:hypothetical protein LTR24_010214 [Lithohypha guttulata]KAK5317264.1 hypothetical protein LTR70_005881 [Exophiala xenobiotica]
MPSGRRPMRSSERNYVSEFDSSDNVILNPLYTNPSQVTLPLQTASRHPQGRRQGNATDHGHPGDIGQREQVFALGTREDVQHEDYVSPIFGMFNRAWTRYRDAEEERQSEAARQHADDLDDDAYRWTDHDEIDVQAISFRTVQQENIRPTDEQRHAVTRQRLFDASPLTMDTMLREGQAQMDRNIAQAVVANESQETIYLRRASTDSNVASSRRDPPLQDVANVNPIVSEQTLTGQPLPRTTRRARHNFHGQFYSNPFDEQRPLRYHNDGRVIDLTDEGPLDRINPIDAQRQRRPAPAKSEDLKVNFACKICQEQKIDTICLPCMHAATCRWCNELWKDNCRDINGRVDRRDWKCVICRKQIKETKKFFI